MKKLIFCAVGVAMFSNVANAATCKDFDDDMNLVEYECGTSLSAAIKANKEKYHNIRKSRSIGPNVIDGNPLYMPKAGHFYSETALSSHSETTKDWALVEEFGYGISDKLAVSVKTGLIEEDGFENYGWENLALKATFRVFQNGNIVADVYGGYTAEGSLFAPVGDDNFWFEEYMLNYKWTAGVRAGYTTGTFTVAGHIAYDYTNLESFNWGDDGLHQWVLGLDGQFVINNMFNLVAGVEYVGVSNDKKPILMPFWTLAYMGNVENAGRWTGMFGVNYNIDATQYVGAYVNGAMNHQGGDAADEWEIEDDFGFGVKFGVQF